MAVDLLGLGTDLPPALIPHGKNQPRMGDLLGKKGPAEGKRREGTTAADLGKF